MTKKILYFIFIVTLLNIPIIAKADGDVDGNGTATDSSTTQTAEEGLHIASSNQYGIRITIIDSNGNRISRQSYDYWNGAFDNSTIYQVQGASYKTDIVNRGGISSTDFSTYSFQYSTDNGKNIGGLSRSNRHNDIENIIIKAISGEKCQEPAFFNDVGYEICPKLKDNCEELKKTYILIEPLVRMHKVSGGAWYVFSGTEAVNYFPNAYNNGLISLKTYKNNFGGSVYRNLVDMYLSNLGEDSLDYQLKSASAKYAYFTSAPTSKNITNESSTNLDLFAGKTRDSNGNVWGSSMQLVWLGGKAADKCQDDCCVPCDPDDKECIKNAGEKYDKDDPYCCEADKIEEDGVCKDSKDYWNGSDDEHDLEIMCPNKCCIPCDPEDKECIKNAGEKYDKDDPYCCYADKIEEDGVCKDSKDYWDDSDEKHKLEIMCPNKCCVACNPEDEECIKNAGDRYDPDDPSCCYAEQIEFDNKCINQEEYWEKVEEDTGYTKLDICPNECCTPCDENDEECINTSDDPFCCNSSYIQKEIVDEKTGDTKNVCVEAETEYWPEHEDILEYYCSACCIVTDTEDCCDTEEDWVCVGDDKVLYSEYWTDEKYKRLCAQKDGICPDILTNPEIIVNYCDEDNENNISYFRDPVFNSGANGDSGQFAGLTISDVEETAKNNNGKLPSSWAERIATENDVEEINTFYAVAGLNDSRYSTKINNYCYIHCQELFEVELPDNYPTVNAGRYFTWTVKDSATEIARAVGGKLCAVDIDLDKAIDNYLDASEDARLAAQNELSFICNGDKIGVANDSNSGAAYSSCGEYHDDYTSFQCNSPIKQGQIYTSGYAKTGPEDCCVQTITYPCRGEHGEATTCSTCIKYEKEYQPVDVLTAEQAIEKVYNGGTVYPYVGSTCNTPGNITDYHSVNRPLAAINQTKNESLAPGSWCNAINGDYSSFVSGFSSRTSEILTSIKACHTTGELVLDMGVELEYETIINKLKTDGKSYSTDNEEIIKTELDTKIYEGQACVDKFNTSCYEDRDNDNYIDTYFYMDPTTRHMQNEDIKWASLTCNNNVSNWGFSNKESGVSNPNAQFGLLYNPKDVKMLNVDSFNIPSQQFTNRKQDYSFYDSEKNKPLWNTSYLSFISKTASYELADKINACVCQDGEVLNLDDDGNCSCERRVPYEKFSEYVEYNNYQILPNGNLSVEFMNGSGAYPINLKYWNLGSIDEKLGMGHFDSLVTEPGIYDYSNTELCDSSGCTYGGDKCRFIIKNKIISEPTDPGTCEDEPCDDPSDVGKCINDDGEINPDCRNPGGLDVIYRIVDVNDPFPNRTASSNWLGKESIITCKDADNKDVDGECNNTLNNDGNFMYSFTLTPAVIKEIRKDSASVNDGSKVDYAIGTVIYPYGEAIGGAVSLFMHYDLTSYVDKYTTAGTHDINLNEDRFSDIVGTLGSISFEEVN